MNHPSQGARAADRISFVVAAAVLFASFGCSGLHSEPDTKPSNTSNRSTEGSTAAPREAVITLRPGVVIEVAYASVKTGMEPQLFGEYFPKAMPLVAEYGGQGLGTFQVERTLDGTASPEIIALFQWPSVESFLALHADPRFQKIVPLRDEALAYMDNANFYTVDQPWSLTVQEGQPLDLWGAWADTSAIAQLAHTVAALPPGATFAPLRALRMNGDQHTEITHACQQSPYGTTEWSRFALLSSAAPSPSNTASHGALAAFVRQRDRQVARAERYRVQFSFPPAESN